MESARVCGAVDTCLNEAARHTCVASFHRAFDRVKIEGRSCALFVDAAVAGLSGAMIKSWRHYDCEPSCSKCYSRCTKGCSILERERRGRGELAAEIRPPG